jgi:hypothetical protein
MYADKNNKPLSFQLQIKKLLNTSVLIKYGLVFIIAAAAIVFLIIRSGNTQLNVVSGAEAGFRTFLENTLVARPRTKELIAFPLTMLILYFSLRKNKAAAFLAMIAAMVGVEDIVNSFSHLRMPVMISTLSSLYSIIFGIVGGMFIAVDFLGVSSGLFMYGVKNFFYVTDVIVSLTKALVFGLGLSILGCYYGFNAGGGAEGVGRAAIKAYVTAAVFILLSDFVVAAIAFKQ